MKPLRQRPPTSTWCRPGHLLTPNRRRAMAATASGHPGWLDEPLVEASPMAQEPPDQPEPSREQRPDPAHPRLQSSAAPPPLPAPPTQPPEPPTPPPLPPASLTRAPALLDAYGSKTRGVEDLTLLVAQLLDVEFVFRDSSAYGEHYDYQGPGGENIEIRDNVEDDDGLLMEPTHPEFRSFVYVSRSPRALAIGEALASIGDVEHVRCELMEQ